MDCEGTVTEINPLLCYFSIQDKRINLSLLMASRSNIGLPVFGSNVIVKNVIQDEMSYIATDKSELIGESRRHQASTEYLNLIKTLNLDSKGIIVIDRILNLMHKNFHKIAGRMKFDLVVSTIKQLFNETENCGDKSVISVSNCRHVESKRSYEGFPYWSFGIHPKATQNTILMGHLTVHQLYGFLILKDSNYGMVCVVCNITEQDVIPLVDTYVLISYYKVVTEIYRDCDNFEYILLRTDDIKILFRPQSFVKQVLSKEDIVEENKYQNHLEFTLVGKSEVCLSSKNQPICWLKVRIGMYNGIEQDHMAFLLLPQKFVQLVIHLKLHHRYRLYYNQQIKQTTNIELSRIATCKIFELDDTSACFQHLEKDSRDNSDLKIFTLEECKRYVQTDTKLVSFEGKIHRRKFNETFSSRSYRSAPVDGFGLPGSKSTQIVFSWHADGKKYFLDWYLNNWESIFMPFGLVPEMKIIIRNVLPQSKKYLKSCIFTSIEIVSHEVAVDFCTANLYEEIRHGWGPKYFFGRGWDIPNGVLISGIVYNITILGVKIKYICKSCKEKRRNAEKDGLCYKCQEEEKDMEFFLTMHVIDQFGESKVLVKDVNFLRFILRLPKRAFLTWLEAVRKIGTYTYTIQGEPQAEEAIHPHHESLRQQLSMFFDNFNKVEIIELNLLCRKLDSSPKTNEGRSLWFYVDARSQDYCIKC